MAGGRPEIHVAAGVLVDAADRVLIAQRPSGKHAGGFWEFPGGKLDAGESPREGLDRELAEELGIAVHRAEPLIDYVHDYPERRVHLHVFRVEAWGGVPTGREGQPLRWVPLAELAEAGILPADRRVLDALGAR